MTRDGGNSWITINTAGIANCGDAEGCGTASLFFFIRTTLRRSLPGHAGSGEDPAAEGGTLRMHSAENWTGVPVARPAPQTRLALFGHWPPEGLPPAQTRRLSMQGRTTEESGSPPTRLQAQAHGTRYRPSPVVFRIPRVRVGTSCPYPVSAIALDPTMCLVKRHTWSCWDSGSDTSGRPRQPAQAGHHRKSA